MLKGKSYLDKPVTDLQIKHLRIIISNPNEDNEFLTVSVDTFKFDWQDSSCIINSGEHPFIKHKSFVNYRYAEVISFGKIFNALRLGLFIKKEDVSPELLLKIQNGARVSRHFDEKLKSWFDLF